MAGNQSESSATTALADGTGSEIFQPKGDRAAHASSNFSKPGICFAATVFMGPAATKLTRMFFGPRCLAKYLDVD